MLLIITIQCYTVFGYSNTSFSDIHLDKQPLKMLMVGHCQDVTDLDRLCAGEDQEDREDGDEEELFGEEDIEDTIYGEQETEVENDNQDDVGNGESDHTGNREKYQEILSERSIIDNNITMHQINEDESNNKKELFLSAMNTYCTNNSSKTIKSYSTKLKSLIVLVCFSHREHSWTSTAPKWKLSGRKHIKKRKVDYLKHIDVSKSSLIEEELSRFKYVTSWKLPQFKVHHVRLF